MKDDSFYDRYSDLLEGENHELEAVVRQLDSMRTSAQPPPSLTRSVSESIRGYKPRRRLLARLSVGTGFTSPMALVAACLIAVLVFSGAAYAALPIIQEALGVSPVTQSLAEHKDGKHLTLTQTSHGFRVSIERAYADKGKIVVAYVVSGPPGRKFNSYDVPAGNSSTVLTDEQGREYQRLRTGPLPVSWGVHVRKGGAGYVEVYKMPELRNPPKQLHLKFTIPSIGANEIVREPGSGNMTDHPVMIDCSSQSSPIRCLTVKGPFTFKFTVPVQDRSV